MSRDVSPFKQSIRSQICFASGFKLTAKNRVERIELKIVIKTT
jgi:hypothetical protein